MKKSIKILYILIIAFMLIGIFNETYAIDYTKRPNLPVTKSTTINPDNYKPGELNEDESTIDMAKKIIGAFQAIGSIVSVLALAVIGIKYMLGSVEEKAQFKGTMIYYVIGAILVFAISNISALIYDFASGFNT